MTALALVEVDTRIGRHDFDRRCPALRAGKRGFENNLRLHKMVSNAPHERHGHSRSNLALYRSRERSMR